MKVFPEWHLQIEQTVERSRSWPLAAAQVQESLGEDPKMTPLCFDWRNTFARWMGPSGLPNLVEETHQHSVTVNIN